MLDNIPADLIAWLRPALFAVGGLVLGVIVDRVLVGQLCRLAQSKNSAFFTDLVKILGHAPVVWLLAAGIHLAMLNVPIPVSESAARTISNTLFVIVALTITLMLARIAVTGIGYYTTRITGVLPSASILGNLVRLGILIIGGLIILQSLGISITPVLTALGVGGLAVSLALQDTLSNLFAGLQIIASRRFHPGDYVKLDSGEEGIIRDISWRIVTVETLTQQTHVIPNSKLSTNIVTNYSLPEPEMNLLIPVGVSYASDLAHVERVTVEVAREVQQTVEGAVPDWEPYIRYNQFGDSSINFNVVVRITGFRHHLLVRHEFIKRLHVRFNSEGIEIPFPIRTVYLRNTAANAETEPPANPNGTPDA
ncbi:MAG: mechanosensitive ion channel family protein [Armatimonadaceae bacterium]